MRQRRVSVNRGGRAEELLQKGFKDYTNSILLLLCIILSVLYKIYSDTVFRVGQLHFGSSHGTSKTQAVTVSVWTAGFMRLEAELPCQTHNDGTIIKTAYMRTRCYPEQIMNELNCTRLQCVCESS